MPVYSKLFRFIIDGKDLKFPLLIGLSLSLNSEFLLSLLVKDKALISDFSS